MARYILTCLDCGADHEVRRSDACYCPPCRLLRNLEWAAAKYKRSRKCRACTKPFRFYRARDTANCGACQERTETRPPSATCALCGQATAGTDGVPVCRACVKAPKVQTRVIAALRKGRVDRRAAHRAAHARVYEDPASRLLRI